MAVHRPEPRDDVEERDDLDLVVGEGHAALAEDAVSLIVEELTDGESDLAPRSTAPATWLERVFGTREFFRLWLVQVVSATGDWLGFSAIIVLAARLGGGAGAGAISLVMAARIVPGFFFGPLAGVLVDRWDRKRVMVACDLGRAAVLATLPFVRNIAGLVLASLALEVFTLLWSPAKDSEVPNLVDHDHLTAANSLSLAAAYGTFPFASLLFALLAGVSVWVGKVPGLGWLENNQMALAFYVDVATFLFSAWMISRLTFARRPRRRPDAGRAGTGSGAGGGTGKGGRRVAVRSTIDELREGWQVIFSNHTVRAVNLGLATGLIGGGMLIPLGAVFSTEVLDSGVAGYGLFTTALGFGVALGVVGVSALQKRLPKRTVFIAALFAAGLSLFLAASSSTLTMAVVFVGLMGVSVGPVYVIGFVLLQEEVDDEVRGRVFSSLNTVVRLCVLISMVAGPLLAAVLGRLSTALVDGSLDIPGGSIALPGVRLALWLAAVIILGAGFAAMGSLRSGQRVERAGASSHPSRHDPR